MVDIIWEYLLFLAEVATILIAIMVVFSGIVGTAIGERKTKAGGYVEIISINELLNSYRHSLQSVLLSPKAYKLAVKTEQKKIKGKLKAADAKFAKKTKPKPDNTKKSDSADDERRMFYIEFHGDLRANSVNNLRHEVAAVLTSSQPGDEVLVSIESGGGMVSSYGFAASLLQRLIDGDLKLTVAIDKVAASGGYLMACVADNIIAAPFAFVGSIGVVAQVPNFYRLLQEHHVDMDVFTSGEHKRQVTLFGENTDSGKQKFQESLEDIHEQFKEIVALKRPDLNIEQVSTGEVWLAQKAQKLGLVDELITCDAYLMQACDKVEVVQVKWINRTSRVDRLIQQAEQSLHRVVGTLKNPLGF